MTKNEMKHTWTVRELNNIFSELNQCSALALLLFIIHDYFLKNSYIFMIYKIKTDINFKQSVLKGSGMKMYSQNRIKTINNATI